MINTVVFDFLTYGTHVFFQDVEQASLYIIIKICPKQGQGFKPSAAHLYPNIGRVPFPDPPRSLSPPPAPGALDHEPFYICEYTSAQYSERRSKKFLSKVNHDYPRTETSLLAFAYRAYRIPGNILHLCDLLVHIHFMQFVCNVGS